MTWWEYVTRIGGDNQSVIARKIGLSTATVSRWRKSAPTPENVGLFAKKFEQPVLEAFIAAGFLTPEEAGERPRQAPSLDELDDSELLDEVARRMRRGETNGDPEAPEKTRNGGPTPLRQYPSMQDKAARNRRDDD